MIHSLLVRQIAKTVHRREGPAPSPLPFRGGDPGAEALSVSLHHPLHPYELLLPWDLIFKCTWRQWEREAHGARVSEYEEEFAG